ncbi:DUF397 domain-containing protein [Nocardia terpenica]|uniref:DUF397 domain-containing protein n=1 Tax=Nocardia terpenica TaxID=455432 RepID=UPI002FDF61A2
MSTTSTDKHGRAWFKSSFSKEAASCVEVSFVGDTVLIRDSKYLREPSNVPAAQPIIELSAADWTHFLSLALGRPTPSVPAIHSITHHSDDTVTITATNNTTLTYTPTEWSAFLAGIQAGEFAAV